MLADTVVIEMLAIAIVLMTSCHLLVCHYLGPNKLQYRSNTAGLVCKGCS